MNEDKPILSICIVSYNRRNELKKTINRLTQNYVGGNIEVIISDDGSTDGTIEEMNNYARKYNWIKFYTRDIPLGAIKNWMFALSMGSGKFVMTLNDRDTIETDNLNNFIDILNTDEDIVGGYCDPFIHDDVIKYYDGIDILFKVAYRSLHPSGYFFRRDKLNELSCMEEYLKYFTKENVGFWPHDFVMAECFNKGRVLLYRKKLVVKSKNEYIATHRSGVDTSTVENIWFSPKQRFAQFIRIIKHIQSLHINEIKKYFLINKVLYRQLRYATIIYASYRKNKYESLHYGLEIKSVSKLEIKEIINYFKMQYCEYLRLEQFNIVYLMAAKIICDCYGLILGAKF